MTTPPVPDHPTNPVEPAIHVPIDASDATAGYLANKLRSEGSTLAQMAADRIETLTTDVERLTRQRQSAKDSENWLGRRYDQAVLDLEELTRQTREAAEETAVARTEVARLAGLLRRERSRRLVSNHQWAAITQLVIDWTREGESLIATGSSHQGHLRIVEADVLRAAIDSGYRTHAEALEELADIEEALTASITSATWPESTEPILDPDAAALLAAHLLRDGARL